MKEWLVQFVSGTVWDVREIQGSPFLPQSVSWIDHWRVERLDLGVDGSGQTTKRSMGIWHINMDNVEAIKES